MSAIRPFVAAIALAAGCGGGSTVTAPPPEQALVASKLATLAIGISVAPQGRSFLDNFLPCPRRGVIDYSNTERGRRATFTGCDAGDGIVVDGTAEVRWTTPGGDRNRLESLDLVGPVSVRVSGSAPATVAAVQASGIAFASAGPSSTPLLLSLVTENVRVTAFGATTALDPRAAPAVVFAPPLTIESIPNPTGTLAALDETDVKRLGFHAGTTLASLLLNETLEVQRGPHVHTEPCGTITVTIDAARNLPRLAMDWNACPLGYGLFASGRFTAEWTTFAAQATTITMLLAGDLTLGGGVPRVQLGRFEWTAADLGPFPRTIELRANLLDRTGTTASHSWRVLVDD